MSTSESAEEEMISTILVVIRNYVRQKDLMYLEKQIDQIEQAIAADEIDDLDLLSQIGSEETCEIDSQLRIEITINDLKEDVQEFISKQLGYQSVEEMLEKFDTQPVGVLSLNKKND